jgi:hypothetical protein
MLPLDLVTAIAVMVGGSCFADVLRRLRRPGIVPRCDWVVNIEASGLSLCMSIVLMDVIAHFLAAHGVAPPPTPFAGPT